MNRFGLYGLAAALSITASIILWGGWWNTNPPPWQSPQSGLIASNDASISWIDYQDRTSVLYFPGNWSSTASHTSNPVTKTFNYSGSLKADGAQDVTYAYLSGQPDQIVINGKSYNLAKGEVFVLNATGDVEQLPVRPLKPLNGYLETLSKYLKTIGK